MNEKESVDVGEAQMTGNAKDFEVKNESASRPSIKAWWLDGPSLQNARCREIFDVPPKKKGTSSTWLEFEQNL
jgi:hypothetical protein